MKAVAKLKGVPMSARKMRLVVNNIRGLDVDKALNQLRYTRKEAATWLEKLVLSAIANWEQKAGVGQSSDEYGLVISEVYADQGSQLKRFRPAPYGRAHRIRKHTCHVFLALENTIPLNEDLEEDEEYEEVEELEEDVVIVEDTEQEDDVDEVEEEAVEEGDDDETENDKG